MENLANNERAIVQKVVRREGMEEMAGPNRKNIA